jgi:C_GCAxxG_C_C family probable redox protein
MHERIQDAVGLFRSGFSCSQAVFAAYSEAFGLERELALKIAQPLGGGIAQRGEICGAVSGALLVIGLKHGRTRPDDTAAKETTYRLIHEFIQRFQGAQGTIVCKELLGFDLSTPEGHDQAAEKGLFEDLCPELVRTAASILEELLF